MPDLPDGAMLMIALEAAVPLWILQMQTLSFEQRQEMTKDAGQMLAEHGDDLMFGGRYAGVTFNALAKGIAMCAFQPGGVTFHGSHWEAYEKVKAAPPAKAAPRKIPADILAWVEKANTMEVK